MQTKIPEPT